MSRREKVYAAWRPLGSRAEVCGLSRDDFPRFCGGIRQPEGPPQTATAPVSDHREFRGHAGADSEEYLTTLCRSATPERITDRITKADALHRAVKGADSTAAMRIRSAVSIFLFLVSLATRPGTSQNSSGPGSRNSNSLIIAISTAEHADSDDVEVTFTKSCRRKSAQPSIRTAWIFDFPGSELAHPQKRLAVNHQSVLTVRASEFSVEPPIARVVIDLKSAQNHHESYDGNKLIITVASGEASSVPVSKEDSAADIQPLAAGSAEGSNRATAESS